MPGAGAGAAPGPGAGAGASANPTLSPVLPAATPTLARIYLVGAIVMRDGDCTQHDKPQSRLEEHACMQVIVQFGYNMSSLT